MTTELQLSKRIPARIKTVTARWCKRDFLTMCDRVRGIWNTTQQKKMFACYWCGHTFIDDEKMALAAFDGKIGNRTLCQKCATELLESEPEAPDE